MFLECIPRVQWWVKAIQGATLILHSNFTFQKQSALSQYSIIGGNGLIKLSVPTKKASRKGSFEKVEISYEEDWQTEHWKSIESAYQKAPFFIYYNYKIEPVFKTQFAHLSEFNAAMIKVIVQCVKSSVSIEHSDEVLYYSELKVEPMEPYPQVFDSKHGFNGELSVLDLLFNLGPETLDYLYAQPS